MVDAERELLRNASQEMNLSLSGNQIDQLIAHTDLLEKWNRAYNFDGDTRPARDLFPPPYREFVYCSFCDGSPSADVGTGAGLPGVPLAILEPVRDLYPLDSNGKKTRFLSRGETFSGFI